MQATKDKYNYIVALYIAITNPFFKQYHCTQITLSLHDKTSYVTSWLDNSVPRG